jgi:hypothetical protein
MEQIVDLDKLLFQLKQQASGPLMSVLKKLLSRQDLVSLLKALAARQEALTSLLKSLASRQDALALLKEQASRQDVIHALVPAPTAQLCPACP